MNVKLNKSKRNGTKGMGFYSGRRSENQKNYLHNWDRNLTVKPAPVSRKIRKGA